MEQYDSTVHSVSSSTMSSIELAEKDLIKFEGYARESEALRNFLERQVVGRKRRAVFKKYLSLRSKKTGPGKDQWNGSTAVGKDITTRYCSRKYPGSAGTPGKKSYDLAKNMHTIHMDNVRPVGLRPVIEASLKGFKSRFEARKDYVMTKKILDDLQEVKLDDDEDADADKEEKMTSPSPSRSRTMSQYARESESKHVQKIRAATKAREVRKQALSLRSSSSPTKVTPRSQRRRNGKKEKMEASAEFSSRGWNLSVQLPEERTKFFVPHNTVLDPDFYDRYSHRPNMVAKAPEKSFDATEVKKKVQSVLQHFDLSPPKHPQGQRLTKGGLWADSTKSYLRKRDNKIQDIASEVKSLVQTSEKKDRRAKRLERKGMSYLNTMEHESVMANPDVDAAHLFGMVEKDEAVRSDTVTKHEMAHPLRHDFRESAIPDNSGMQASHDDVDMAVEYMGRTWRDRLARRERKEKVLRKERVSHASSLSVAGAVAVEKERKRRERTRRQQKETEAMMERLTQDKERYHSDTVESELRRRHSVQHKNKPPSTHKTALVNICMNAIKGEAIKADGTFDLEFLAHNVNDFQIDKSLLPATTSADEDVSELFDALALAMADDYIKREHRHEKRAHDF